MTASALLGGALGPPPKRRWQSASSLHTPVLRSSSPRRCNQSSPASAVASAAVARTARGRELETVAPPVPLTSPKLNNSLTIDERIHAAESKVERSTRRRLELEKQLYQLQLSRLEEEAADARVKALESHEVHSTGVAASPESSPEVRIKGKPLRTKASQPVRRREAEAAAQQTAAAAHAAAAAAQEAAVATLHGGNRRGSESLPALKYQYFTGHQLAAMLESSKMELAAVTVGLRERKQELGQVTSVLASRTEQLRHSRGDMKVLMRILHRVVLEGQAQGVIPAEAMQAAADIASQVGSMLWTAWVRNAGCKAMTWGAGMVLYRSKRVLIGARTCVNGITVVDLVFLCSCVLVFLCWLLCTMGGSMCSPLCRSKDGGKVRLRSPRPLYCLVGAYTHDISRRSCIDVLYGP